MRSESIEFKVTVFISSKCGGKYTIVRKALKELLLETGMTKVYCFETAPGSSQPMPDAYLQYVEESHLCVFLIDNKDDITEAVLSEHQRAKEQGKKRIYVFCDEKKKCPTELQKEVIVSGCGKYSLVHEFSDITKEAYRSIIQDIIEVYNKKTDELSTPEKEIIIKKRITSFNNYIIDKNKVLSFDKTRNELISIINPFENEKEKNTSELDDLAKDFINVVLCNKKFESFDYSKMTQIIIDMHDPIYKDVIALRMQAVQLYYDDNMEECVKILKEALHMASADTKIANWISNDVAIDLRNMIGILDEENNRLSVENEGQTFINKNVEPVFFPLIDRIENNISEEIITHYFRTITDSPYTTNLGLPSGIFKGIADCFCIGMIYGSITHIRITCSRIIKALSALCFEYSDHFLYIELLKMLIIEREDKDIQKFLRIYNQSVDVLNSNDIAKLLSCIECIPIKYRKINSLLILYKYFGYYFSDEQYTKIHCNLFSFACEWIDDENRVFNSSQYIFKAFAENNRRMDNNDIAYFLIKVLYSPCKRWYNDAFELSYNIDYKSVSIDNQKKILSKSIELLSDPSTESTYENFKQHLIKFRLTSTISVNDLDKAIENNMSTFFFSAYHLEIFDKDKDISLVHIKRYVDSINRRNEEQGKNGVFHGYGNDPYGTIINIINKNKIELNWHEMYPILESVKNTLVAPKQGYQDKCRAIMLIVFLRNHYSTFAAWNKFIEMLREQEDRIITGYDSDMFGKEESKRVLYVCYHLLMLPFGKLKSYEAINTIISIPNMSDFEIIRSLKCIHSLLINFDYDNADDSVILTIVQLASMMTNHKERDVKFHAVKCLVQLTHSKFTQIVLNQLSNAMDMGTSIIKASIVGRVKQMNRDNPSIIDYIIQKGKVDNNYLVREIANKI